MRNFVLFYDSLNGLGVWQPVFCVALGALLIKVPLWVGLLQDCIYAGCMQNIYYGVSLGPTPMEETGLDRRSRDVIEGQQEPWPAPWGVLELPFKLFWVEPDSQVFILQNDSASRNGLPGKGHGFGWEGSLQLRCIPWRGWQLKAVHWPSEAGAIGPLSQGNLGGVSQFRHTNVTSEWVFWQRESPAWRVISWLQNVTLLSWARFSFMTLGRCPEISCERGFHIHYLSYEIPF